MEYLLQLFILIVPVAGVVEPVPAVPPVVGVMVRVEVPTIVRLKENLCKIFMLPWL